MRKSSQLLGTDSGYEEELVAKRIELHTDLKLSSLDFGNGIMNYLGRLISMVALLCTTMPAFCDLEEDYTQSGTDKYRKGDFVGAIADYSKVIQLKPDNAIAYYNRGLAENDKGDLDTALADYDKAIQLEPAFAFAYSNRGNTKKTKGDLTGALADFNKAIELKPDYALAYCSRGNAKALKGDLDGALADYDKAIQLKPDDDVTYQSRGYAKQAIGDLDGALVDYTKAIELKPDDAFTYYYRGIAKQGKVDMKGALDDFSKAIKLKPDHAGAYHNRGCLRYDSQDFTNALADFRRVLNLDSSEDYARFRVWLVRARLGEKRSATEEMQTFWNSHKTGAPNDWPSKIFRFLMGQLPEGDFLKAAEDTDSKKKPNGQRCEAYFFAGSKRLIEGDKTTAKNYFEKCVATGVRNFFEYQSANAELKYLKAQ